MKLKVALVALGVVVVVAALGAYVALTAGRELFAARGALSGAPQRLDAEALGGARDHLEAALDDLDSVPARILGVVPVARQNVAAVRTAASSALPVLDAAIGLERRIDAVERAGLMVEGAVDLDLVHALERPLGRQARALARLESNLEGARSGWLLPPLWTQLDGQLERARALSRSARRAVEAVEHAPEMLGASERRTYLVIMLNNAELRGAGGILSGVGTIAAESGRLDLGDFSYYGDLNEEPPYRPVPAPADYERHFRQYDAATTRWVAASSSPDVPDVAIVAARLYELVRGVRTDGVVVVDARGLAALLPPGARIEVPRTGEVLNRDEFAPFVYSRAYEVHQDQTARRDALIGLGASAFEAVLERGLGGPRGWASVADAVAGGHLRFVSFDASEQAALEGLGASGELGTPEVDGTHVTVQNYGGTKLDYWARRRVRHACDLGGGGAATCSTEVTITNRVPRGLPEFVYQYRPYGLFKNYVEVYVPGSARVTGVDHDGEPARFGTAIEDGYEAVGVYVTVPRGTSARVEVRYRLDLGDAGYELEARPQPLTHPSRLEVRVTVPPGWSATGRGGVADGVMAYSGRFDETMEWRVGPSERTGIPALWARLERFWTEPVL